MALFPATLPPPEVDGYVLDPLDQTIRTDMEVGAPRVRRRTLARLDRVQVRWILSDAEMSAFRAWFQDAGQAAGGAGWFDVSLPLGLGGIQSYEARIVQWQAPLRRGLFWEVTAQLEVRVRSPAAFEAEAAASATAKGAL